MTPPPPEGWRSSITLLHADYRETLQAAADAGGVDLLLTSPPYCDARTYGADVSWDMEDYARLGDYVARALKPGGWALVNVDAPVRNWRPGFGSERGLHPWRMLLDWSDRVGLRVPDRLAFGRQGIPGEYGGRFRNDWEPLLWFQRPGAEGYFDRTALAEDGTRSHGIVVRHRKPDGVRVSIMKGWAAENGKAHRGTLWNYGNVGSGHTGAPYLEAEDHPARWPYRLAADIIQCFAPPDGLVCDPFLGAGTSAVAAFEFGRRFIGGDLYARATDGRAWVDVAADVLDARSAQLRLFPRIAPPTREAARTVALFPDVGEGDDEPTRQEAAR
jgi:hypothetical protein